MTVVKKKQKQKKPILGKSEACPVKPNEAKKDAKCEQAPKADKMAGCRHWRRLKEHCRLPQNLC